MRDSARAWSVILAAASAFLFAAGLRNSFGVLIPPLDTEFGVLELGMNHAGELTVLSGYMPEQLSEAEVAAEVQAAVAQTGAAGPQDMGKVMGVLKPKLAGRADMTAVSGLVKAALAK